MPSNRWISRGLRGLALAGMVCLGGTPAFVQATGQSPVPGSHAARSRLASIQGNAWHADNTPIPNAIIRLRNVVSGKSEATTVASAAGRFAFTGIAPGTYLAELVSQSGQVLAVGHTFTVGPGETVATFVRLGGKGPWFTTLFGNAALAIVSGVATVGLSVADTAASLGIPAVSPETITAVSPNR
jgi:Carboxypeptidase regulatory-like domain